MVRGGVPVSRSLRRVFWQRVRQGGDIAVAAAVVGVSARTGQAWFAEAGGMPDVSLVEPASGRSLSMDERVEISLLAASGRGVREIARALGRSASGISTELRLGRSPDGQYRPHLAQRRADGARSRPQARKLATSPRLAAWVQGKLDGDERWSPQQIANRLKIDFPDDESMRISHETIYQALYVQGRGGLRKELTSALRTGRARRKPRAQATSDGRRTRVPDEVLIANRPAEVADRAVPGNWEGDLIMGTANRSAIGTLVERTTRFTILLHLPHGHRAEHVRDAILAQITDLPAHLRTSLTWDQGAEMLPSAHAPIIDDLTLWFCDPHSPWQRGTNENTNGLLRQYFPKGTDLSQHTAERLDEVAAALNRRPRQTLSWATPAEAFTHLLLAA
jgi:IS30 family transposase